MESSHPQPLKVNKADFHIEGTGDGITVRRTSDTGRYVLDLEVTGREAQAVREALEDMYAFRMKDSSSRGPDGSPIDFDLYPNAPVKTGFEVLCSASITGTAFSQGVNEMQTYANTSPFEHIHVQRQVEVNRDSMYRLEGYYGEYKRALLHQMDIKAPELEEVLRSSSGRNSTGESLSSSSVKYNAISKRSSIMRVESRSKIDQNPNDPDVVQQKIASMKERVEAENDRMIETLRHALSESEKTPNTKHVDVLLLVSALSREISGLVSTLCKSGKDRTSMSVTLETTRGLVEELGAQCGQELVQTMRQRGGRRMNAFANTGKSFFAFNSLQKWRLPECYRPPNGCHTGSVVS